MKTDPSKTRVLVADDDPDVAEMLVELIRLTASFPVEIAIFRDGTQALAKAISDCPDCSILGADMPVLDGVSAAIAIRIELGVDVPVLIFLTGDPRHLFRAGAQQAFDHFFEKPANVDELVALVAASRPRRYKCRGTAGSSTPKHGVE